MRMIRDKILFRPFAGSEISEGGIVVPESSRKPSNKGVIEDAGPGIAGKPMKFKKGDVVFRVKDWGDEIWQDGVQYFIMTQDSLLAKLN